MRIQVIWILGQITISSGAKWCWGGQLDWEHYQEAVEEEFIGWEQEVRVIDEVREGCLIKEIWCRQKEKVLTAAEKGIGKERKK